MQALHITHILSLSTLSNAEQALSHSWLTNFAAPTELDLCANSRTLIHAQCDPHGAALSRFAKSNGANKNKKNQLVLSSDVEDDNVSRSGSPSWRTMPEPDSKRQQQRLSPPIAE
jgi:hypothetical protein